MKSLVSASTTLEICVFREKDPLISENYSNPSFLKFSLTWKLWLLQPLPAFRSLHPKMRLLTRPSSIWTMRFQQMQIDFHCLICMGCQPISQETAAFGGYFPVPRKYPFALFWTTLTHSYVSIIYTGKSVFSHHWSRWWQAAKLKLTNWRFLNDCLHARRFI